jgi:hypothetical protein
MAMHERKQKLGDTARMGCSIAAQRVRLRCGIPRAEAANGVRLPTCNHGADDSERPGAVVSHGGDARRLHATDGAQPVAL